MLQASDRERMLDELAEAHAADAHAPLRDERGRRFAGDDGDGRARALQHGGEKAADAADAEDRHPVGVAAHVRSTSTPGLRIHCGSSVALAARSAAANGSGRWRSYHGR